MKLLFRSNFETYARFLFQKSGGEAPSGKEHPQSAESPKDLYASTEGKIYRSDEAVRAAGNVEQAESAERAERMVDENLRSLEENAADLSEAQNSRTKISLTLGQKIRSFFTPKGKKRLGRIVRHGKMMVRRGKKAEKQSEKNERKKQKNERKGKQKIKGNTFYDFTMRKRMRKAQKDRAQKE